jgi:carbamoyl-phosphate synthase/aspartate carbamoyltransferase/dihydroorotase
VSRKEHLHLALAAKDRGLPLTVEATPHHLFLTEADAERLGPLGMMKPPLATAEDQKALWEHLNDFDCIATDHAPHTREEKLGDAPPPGIPGIETALPLLLDALSQGRLDVGRLVELIYTGPARIFPITPPPETWIEVDPEARYELRAGALHSKCTWTPFEGVRVSGRILRTWIRGQLAYELGTVLAAPGTGRDLVQASPTNSAEDISQVQAT